MNVRLEQHIGNGITFVFDGRSVVIEQLEGGRAWRVILEPAVFAALVSFKDEAAAQWKKEFET